MPKSALFCGHANENPSGECPCSLDCYCRGYTCKARTPMCSIGSCPARASAMMNLNTGKKVPVCGAHLKGKEWKEPQKPIRTRFERIEDEDA